MGFSGDNLAEIRRMTYLPKMDERDEEHGFTAVLFVFCRSNAVHFSQAEDVSAEREGIMRNWKSWIKAAGIRAIKTVAQTAVAMLPASAMITEVGWEAVIGTAALAGVASLLTSLAGIPEEGMGEAD